MLLRASTLDEWSSQKHKHQKTRDIRNDISHGGNIIPDIETIENSPCSRERLKGWQRAFRENYGLPVEDVHEIAHILCGVVQQRLSF
jgi:hypothetical protein